MEQKTIGKFISALRKAEGMTQKDLAEKLNVSDKSVSRWERDEGAPDISMIPVIAEVFGVTCDELLRGERKPAAERVEAAPEEKSFKAEKQMKRLIKLALFRFRSQNYIALGLSLVGVIAALVANLAYTAALLGFFLALSFIVAAVVCEGIFIGRAFLSVEDAELDSEDISDFKKKVVTLGEFTFGVITALLGFVFPLLFVKSYYGLMADELLLWGSICAAVFRILYSVVLYFVNGTLKTNGTLVFTEKEEEAFNYRRKVMKYTALTLLAVLIVTGILHYNTTILWGPGSVMKGITFDDYESFIAYMEEDVPMSTESFYGSDTEYAIAPVPDSETIYYDEDGNIISEEESLRHTVEDENGVVVCEYIQRNQNVCSISHSAKDGSALPITVRTYDDVYNAKRIIESRHQVFAIVYVFEFLSAFASYMVLSNKKRIK